MGKRTEKRTAMNIFCDLDGGLVDFEKGFEDIHGVHPHAIPESLMWAKISKNERHWHHLPMMPEGRKLWTYIAPHNPIILTGCPRSGFAQADTGKRFWVGTELGDNVEVITCRSKDKSLHMRNPGDILIDDLIPNC